MTFQKATRGKRISIGFQSFNELVDAIHDYRSRAASKVGVAAPEAQVASGTQPRVTRIVNETGQHLNQYAVVGITNVNALPAADDGSFLERVVFRGIAPVAGTHAGRFAVLLQSAPVGAVVPALIAGVAMVKIDDGGVSSGSRAEIVNGQTGYLQLSAHGSAAVLWREEGAGQKWGIVRLGTAPAVFPVSLSMTGGSQGTHQSAATWTYSVSDMEGRLLASGVNPTVLPHRVNRQAWGSINPAQFGFATINGGQLVILQINEIWEPDIHPDARLYEGVLKNP